LKTKLIAVPRKCESATGLPNEYYQDRDKDTVESRSVEVTVGITYAEEEPFYPHLGYGQSV